MEYPVNVYSDVYRDNHANGHQELAELGSTCNWSELIDFLKQNPSFINKSRLAVRDGPLSDLNTPLHWAAIGAAPCEIFEELIALGAAKSLKNSEGKTAFDIAADIIEDAELLDIIRVPPEITEKASEIEKLEKGLHAAIKGRADNLITQNGQVLPQVGFLFEKKEFWFPISGMYGGFSVSLCEKGIETSSWCRVAGGSGQRHVIDREGNVELEEEGFV
ncbi:uncharacterized protein LOC127881808 [Dreissena polymorpha]|uniref:Ankyrin repeat domain-containing protein n=1 Tax=Dreissena polymorpha TaxID=45954 RepID=A0A9D4H5N3_DREPO|nr:uncharacterized protein LOC127881808 [Dreissena polymorpha]KAH3827456.1 hypothetical protein DPMN_129393 [Dreissena polymorpha]